MKKIITTICITLSMSLLVGCSSLADKAQAAVNAYNSELSEYSANIADYNSAVEAISKANYSLEQAMDKAQESLNQPDEPFDPQTKTDLKNAMNQAQASKIEVPEALTEYASLSVDQNADKDTLKAFIEKAETDTEAMKNTTIPETPAIPDVTAEVNALMDAKQKYDNSVQSLRQVTAPSDDFVMDRLKNVDTILAIDHVTEDHDPNGHLNKQGGYIGTVYFTDSEVDRAAHYITTTDVVDAGTDAGGAVEIYPDVESAKKRDDYLGSLNGPGFLDPGSHYVYGTCVIRTSTYLTATQQTDLTQKVLEALIAIE